MGSAGWNFGLAETGSFSVLLFQTRRRAILFQWCILRSALPVYRHFWGYKSARSRALRGFGGGLGVRRGENYAAWEGLRERVSAKQKDPSLGLEIRMGEKDRFADFIGRRFKGFAHRIGFL
jgi:hypothetical protein